MPQQKKNSQEGAQNPGNHPGNSARVGIPSAVALGRTAKTQAANCIRFLFLHCKKEPTTASNFI